ncbi:MAG TPA: hypothetical protein VGJ79_07095, partial [Candidatus Dormibacteraeota bacterium]
ADANKQTIAEIQSDRELEYRPYVSWRLIGVNMNGTQITDPGRIEVANYGRGPAIYCLCHATWGQSGGTYYLATTDLFDVSPNETHSLPVSTRGGWVPDDEIAGVQGASALFPCRLAFCKDQLGNFYRFTPYEPTQQWREEAGPAPRWVLFYQSYYDSLKKA